MIAARLNFYLALLVCVLSRRVSAFDFELGSPNAVLSHSQHSVLSHSQHSVDSPTRNLTVNRNSSSAVSFECSATDFSGSIPINSVIRWGRRLSSDSNNSQPVLPLNLTANLLFNVSTRIDHPETGPRITSSLWIVPSRLCTEDFHFEYVCAIRLPGTSGAVPWSTDGYHLTGVGGGGRTSCTSPTLSPTHAVTTDAATRSTGFTATHPVVSPTQATLGSSAADKVKGQSDTENGTFQGLHSSRTATTFIVVGSIAFVIVLFVSCAIIYQARHSKATGLVRNASSTALYAFNNFAFSSQGTTDLVPQVVRV